MAPTLFARDGGGSSITVGWLLAIALGGGALLFVSLAFILVTLTDRRNQKARLAAEQNEPQTTQTSAYQDLDSASSTNDPDGGSQRPRQHRRRLTKSPQVSPVRRRNPFPPVLPHIRKSSTLGHLFGTPRKNRERRDQQQQQQQDAQGQASWVDEDAIRGSKGKGKANQENRNSKRRSLRESWLMMRTPSLPGLLSYNDDSDAQSFYSHQNYPLVAAPQPAVLAPEDQQAQRPTSRVPLVRTPSFEQAEQRAIAARREMRQMQEGDASEQAATTSSSEPTPAPQVQMPHGPRPPPAAKLRTANTETELQTILNRTARRLRDGSPASSPNDSPAKRGPNPQGLGNRPTRHRRTMASQESPIKNFRQSQGGSSSHGYGALQSTPSPQKRPLTAATPQSAPAAMDQRGPYAAATPQDSSAALLPAQTPTPHGRNVSQSSMASENDSLYGDSTPEPDQMMPAGLSSPSRRDSQVSAMLATKEPQRDAQSQSQSQAQSQQSSRDRSNSVASMTSSVSSALSTVYSEEEPDEDPAPTLNEQLHATTTPDQYHQMHSPRLPRHIPKMSDPFVSGPAPGQAPRIPERSNRRGSTNTVMSGASHHRPQQSSRSTLNGLPLGQISGNAQSTASSPIMSALLLEKHDEASGRDQLRMSIMMSPPPQMVEAGGAGQQQSDMRPRSVMAMKPAFFAASTSIMSMRASPSMPTPEDVRRGHRPQTSHGARSAVVPPPLSLHPAYESMRIQADNDSLELPTTNLRIQRAGSGLVASESVEEIESLPSSPPPNRPLPDPANLPRSPTPGPVKRRTSVAKSPLRTNSIASNTSPDRRDDAKRDAADPSPSRAQTPGLPRRSNNSVKQSSPSHVSPLQQSILELRRMNSQMSTRSVASSAPSEAPESPTLPELRGGGFSPDRSSSRMGKSGRQNYLSMGTPSPSASPSTGSRAKRPGGPRSIKNARNSVTERPKSALKTGLAEQAIEEKENGENEETETQSQAGIDDVRPFGRSGSTKGSMRGSQSPKRRLSVRFGDVEERIIMDGEQEDQEWSTPQASPNRTPSRNVNRASADSLGLYDKDGFLMSSPDRLPSSAAEGGWGSGLRI